MKTSFFSLFSVLLLLIVLSSTPAVSQEKGVNHKKIERERAKNQKKAQKDYEKAVKQHQKNQSKSTKASMKRSKKEAPKRTPINK